MISLKKASSEDASKILEMQIKSFKPLLRKYKDYDTNPASETIDKIIYRLELSNVDYYLVEYLTNIVGAIRIVKLDEFNYRVGQIFILPDYQGKGIAQYVFKIIEDYYPNAKKWELNTIKEEKGNCYLYEKLGYVETGVIEKINDNMTIVYYEKYK